VPHSEDVLVESPKSAKVSTPLRWVLTTRPENMTITAAWAAWLPMMHMDDKRDC
jgi:hypothetical protein